MRASQPFSYCQILCESRPDYCGRGYYRYYHRKKTISQPQKVHNQRISAPGASVQKRLPRRDALRRSGGGGWCRKKAGGRRKIWVGVAYLWWERVERGLGLGIYGGEKGEGIMLAAMALLVSFVLSFWVLSQWADHPERSSSWLIAGLAFLLVALAGLEQCIQMI